MADESTVLKTVRRSFEFVGADVERAAEIYHDDAVLEFPQSGERFEGVATFTEWRRAVSSGSGSGALPHPTGSPPRVDLAVVELSAS